MAPDGRLSNSNKFRARCQMIPMDKTLIIPDIHNRYSLAEQIIRQEKPSMTVFLGDYFDSFGDTYVDAQETARWLSGSLAKKDRIHLIGNHDLSYMTNNPNLKCSGFDGAKYHEIERWSIPWDRLRPYYWLDDAWLCTHAGVSDAFLKQHSIGMQDIAGMAKADLDNIDDPSREHAFFHVGFMRGGSGGVGGPLWCDYDEFVPVPGVSQIFGHTRGRAVRHVRADDSENFCIDTGLHDYAVYRNREMSIKRSIK